MHWQGEKWRRCTDREGGWRGRIARDSKWIDRNGEWLDMGTGAAGGVGALARWVH